MKFKIFSLIIFLPISLIGVEQVSFPYLNGDLVAENDLLYFEIKNKKPVANLSINFIKDGKKERAFPFLISSQDKKKLSGIIWLNVMGNPVFTGKKIELIFGAIQNKNPAKKQFNKELNVVKNVAQAGFLDKKLKDFFIKLFSDLCSGRQSFSVKDPDLRKKIRELANGNSELGKVAKLLTIYFEIDNQISTQTSKVFSEIKKNRKKVMTLKYYFIIK